MPKETQSESDSLEQVDQMSLQSFDRNLQGQTEPRIAGFVIDWDETITASDTLSLLANCSSAAASSWPEFTRLYLDDLNKFEKSWQAKYGTRDTLEKQLQFLGDLEVIEQRSIARIESSGVFFGVTKADVAKAAQTAPIRQGFEAFAAVAGPCCILSVHWSKHFIASALPCQAHGWQIAANELEFGPDGRCTGKVSKSGPLAFRTGIDKQRWMQQYRNEDHGCSGDQTGGLIVYVGDSNTDLPALCEFLPPSAYPLTAVEADIGILIGGNESLLTTCLRIGLKVKPLSDMVNRERGLYMTPSWEEVRTLLL